MANNGKKQLSPFCIRFTEQERKSLEQAAGDRALGAYIRWLIFKDELPAIRTRNKKPVKDHKQLSELIAVLGQSRIASNINQLAKAANSGSLPVNQDVLQSLEESIQAIRWMRETLIGALGLHAQSTAPEVGDDS